MLINSINKRYLIVNLNRRKLVENEAVKTTRGFVPHTQTHGECVLNQLKCNPWPPFEFKCGSQCIELK